LEEYKKPKIWTSENFYGVNVVFFFKANFQRTSLSWNLFIRLVTILSPTVVNSLHTADATIKPAVVTSRAYIMFDEVQRSMPTIYARTELETKTMKSNALGISQFNL